MLPLPLNGLHAQYLAIGAASTVALLLSRVLHWSLPADIHSVWCRELTAAAVFLVVLFNIGHAVAVDVALCLYSGVSDYHLFWPLAEVEEWQASHPAGTGSQGAAC
eukprot:12420442-Karenia_brevis.AAC.1